MDMKAVILCLVFTPIVTGCASVSAEKNREVGQAVGAPTHNESLKETRLLTPSQQDPNRKLGQYDSLSRR